MYLKVAIASILLMSGTFAADAPAPRPISELHATKMELLSTKEQLAQQFLAGIQSDKRSLFMEICRAGGIESPDITSMSKVCSLDFDKRIVVRVTPPSAPVPNK